MNVRVPFHPFSIGIGRKRAKAQTERFLVRMVDLLIAEENHLVTKQRMLDLGKPGVV